MIRKNLPQGQSGFTLLEIAIVLAIAAMLAIFSVPSFLEEINERRATVTVQETQAILDAARVFRVQNGTWPGIPTCANAITVLSGGGTPFLGGIGANNKYNFAYTTSCPGNIFRVTQRAIPDWDSYLANALPGTIISVAATNTIQTTIGVPGTEPALDSKLERLATGNPEDNRMRTTLLMGQNQIQEGGDIQFTKATPVLQSTNGSLTLQSANGKVVTSGESVADEFVFGPGATKPSDAGTKLSDRLPKYVQQGSYLVKHGDGVIKPVCGTGGTPKASLRPGTLLAGYVAGGGGTPGIVAAQWRLDNTAIAGQPAWLVSMNTYGTAPDRNNMDGLVDVFCDYP